MRWWRYPIHCLAPFDLARPHPAPRRWCVLCCGPSRSCRSSTAVTCWAPTGTSPMTSAPCIAPCRTSGVAWTSTTSTTTRSTRTICIRRAEPCCYLRSATCRSRRRATGSSPSTPSRSWSPPTFCCGCSSTRSPRPQRPPSCSPCSALKASPTHWYSRTSTGACCCARCCSCGGCSTARSITNGWPASRSD